jgi:hypothetical protein
MAVKAGAPNSDQIVAMAYWLAQTMRAIHSTSDEA